MSSDLPDPLIADAFRNLNSEDNLPVLTQHALWASWAALFLVAAFLLGLSWLVIDADREAEEIRLKQSTDLVAQSLEARVTGTAEILQKLSMRLMHSSDGGFSAASAELSASTLMTDRREVIEIALISKEGDVQHAWRSTTAQVANIFSPGANIQDAPTLRAIGLVLASDRSTSTPFYSSPNSDHVFLNLVVPAPTRAHVLVARLDLTGLLKGSEQRITNAHYTFTLMLNDRPVAGRQAPAKRDIATSSLAAPILYQAPLLFLEQVPGERMTLSARSYEHALFTTNRMQYFTVAGLAVMLLLAVCIVFYYQRQQHHSHRLLQTEYSLRRAMSESAVVGLRVADLSGRILYVNETFPRIVGYPADELLGIEPPYPYWAEKVKPSLTAALRRSETLPESLRFQARRKNGEAFWAELRLSPLLNEAGRPFGTIGALFDVTPLVTAKTRVEAANERFTRVVESMASALAVLSEPGRERLYFANRAYRTLFSDRPEGAATLLKKLEETPASVQSEGIFDEESGRWFDVRSQPIVWTRSESAIMMIAIDITARRELELAREAQVRRAESTQRLVTMGEMASSLAHELNQPLAAIANYANAAATMLASGTLSKEREAQSFQKIENQAQRAGRIIQRIRGFARKTDAKLEPVAVQTVIQETLELANIQARKFDSTITLSVAEGLPIMQGDSVMLEQLLLNLLKNAMEACASAGTTNRSIELDVKLDTPDTSRIRFSVIDHGPGIPEEARPKLFDAFYSTKNEGMGMGLNICRSIAELHGGELIMRTTPGGGSTFSFTVPVLTGDDVTPSAPV
ncbi:ATP-binding protein [Sutterella sp.]|uniref:PAS domain-containing sensor histidine kinase n=1 Tax=Sutterella sp. TaxID=1981025 RepID=UPI0026DF4D7D|nr:ATP-binding protein [Sutterella sp.]MDO5531317.1 ATP-binding protein [Sutterella sp.]